jgi:Mg-chelatase subunit ChlD
MRDLDAARSAQLAGVLALVLCACSADSSLGARRSDGVARPGMGTPGMIASAGAGAATSGAAGAPLVLTRTGPDGLRDGQCARQDVSATRIVPNVWLVVDGSGSMMESLSQSEMTSRWVVLRGALMDPAMGVVKSLEHFVKWGFVMYDGPLPGGGFGMAPGGAAMTCPRVVTLEPAIDNFAPIDMAYTQMPLGGSTPTDKALDAVVRHIEDMTVMSPDAQGGPSVVVLATDGAPNDFCSMNFNGDVRPQVLAQVEMLTAMNIKVYVISLAGEDMMLTEHLNQVAAAGGTGKPPFIPKNKDELIKTFDDIISANVSCDVTLKGMIKAGSECNGKIEINGVAVPCNSDNGWRLKDSKTITVTGTACEMYKADKLSVLHADFPCDAIILN